MQTELPVVISPSRAESASKCQRRHAVSDVLCYQPDAKDSEHLLFGTVIHSAAEMWWKTRDEDAVERAVRDAWDPSIEERSNLTPELAEFMMRYYAREADIAGEHWAADSEWELVLCEERIALDLGKAELTFKVDRLVRCEETDPPAYVLVDTKTASRTTRYWTRRWPSSLQQKLYAWAVQEELDISLDAHFIEGVLKEAPSEIVYVPLDWPDAVLDEAAREARELAHRDAELVVLAENNPEELKRLALTETRTNGDHCWAYGRKCELYEYCHDTPPEMRAALLDDDFVHREPDWLE